MRLLKYKSWLSCVRCEMRRRICPEDTESAEEFRTSVFSVISVATHPS
jgi:hypothetical protein